MENVNMEDKIAGLIKPVKTYSMKMNRKSQQLNKEDTLNYEDDKVISKYS
jgi:hypothetical protein